MPWAYILKCSDGFFYTGSTWKLESRVAEHNVGLGANFTRKRLPVTLAFAAEFDRIEDAYACEKQIQGWSRAKKIALIEGRLTDLPELSKSKSQRRTGDDVLEPPVP
jgi:putative endonuclease